MALTNNLSTSSKIVVKLEFYHVIISLMFMPGPICSSVLILIYLVINQHFFCERDGDFLILFRWLINCLGEFILQFELCIQLFKDHGLILELVRQHENKDYHTSSRKNDDASHVFLFVEMPLIFIVCSVLINNVMLVTYSFKFVEFDFSVNF